jgi:hypothetical protein
MDRYLFCSALALSKQEQGYGYLDAGQLKRTHGALAMDDVFVSVQDTQRYMFSPRHDY